MKILVTGGTAFVSRYVAEFFAKEHDVYVLNRNTRPQSEGVTLISADRAALGNALKAHSFDAVLDVTSYTACDVQRLLDALGDFGAYVFISSSAVYPETLPRPFREDHTCGPNSIWGQYGTDKLAAEQLLMQRVPHAYILRPPYLYGPMQNVYREPFVFECADADLPFYLPGSGTLPLQFFHVEDLCRFIAVLLQKRPAQHIYNVGNPDPVSAAEWARLCYRAAGKEAQLVHVSPTHPQRSYFPFYDYDYHLDVSRQQALMPALTPLETGLRQSYEWHRLHPDACRKKPFFEYIDRYLK